jgi:hypothetical protein
MVAVASNTDHPPDGAAPEVSFVGSSAKQSYFGSPIEVIDRNAL